MMEIDQQLERDTVLEEANIKRIREQAAKIPVGKPGDCELCGEWSGRLVNGVCAHAATNTSCHEDSGGKDRAGRR